MDPVHEREDWKIMPHRICARITGKRGRNVEVAESAIRQSKSFTADEALCTII